MAEVKLIIFVESYAPRAVAVLVRGVAAIMQIFRKPSDMALKDASVTYLPSHMLVSQIVLYVSIHITYTLPPLIFGCLTVTLQVYDNIKN
jgi:hypothetical protein